MTTWIINHLWQSTVFAALAGLLTMALRRLPARVRFCVWMAASLKFLVPFALFAALGSHLTWRIAVPAAPPPSLAVLAEPFQAADPGFIAPLPGGPVVPAPIDRRPWIAFVIWLSGVLMVAGYWIRRRRQVSVAIRSAIPLTSGLAGFPAPILLTDAAIEPGVFGIFRQVLLLPRGIADRLSNAQLHSVAAHEYCHMERRDNLWSLLHMLVEALFWFHPLIWWLGGRLLAERERACDEAVLLEGADEEIYAQSILQVCRYHTGMPVACVSGISGSNLTQRIAAIMSFNFADTLPRSVQLALTSLAVAAVTAPLAAGLIYGRQTPQSSNGRTFDAISIRPEQLGPNGSLSMGMPRTEQDPETMTIHNMTLEHLVCFAYVEDQGTCGYKLVVKGPAWAATDHFNINARTDMPATLTEKRQMLQAVLVDRFHLVLRRETQSMTAYLLELADHGPKLKPAEKTEKCAQEFAQYGSHVTSNRDGRLTAECISMDELAELVQGAVMKDRPVFDRTGLPKTALYQLNLEVAFPLTDPNAIGPSVFSALPDQLGLKLEAGKAPVEVMIIESAQRPQPN